MLWRFHPVVCLRMHRVETPKKAAIHRGFFIGPAAFSTAA